MRSGRAEALARLLHKLAGTAAMFGEPALGEAAAALERALSRGAAEDHDLAARAREVLAIAAEPGEEPAVQAASGGR